MVSLDLDLKQLWSRVKLATIFRKRLEEKMSSKSWGRGIRSGYWFLLPPPPICAVLVQSLGWAGLFHCTCAGCPQPRTAEALSNVRQAQYPGLHRTRLRRMAAEALGNPSLSAEADNVIFFFWKIWINASTNLSKFAGPVSSNQQNLYAVHEHSQRSFGSEFSHLGYSFPLVPSRLSMGGKGVTPPCVLRAFLL